MVVVHFSSRIEIIWWEFGMSSKFDAETAATLFRFCLVLVSVGDYTKLPPIGLAKIVCSQNGASDLNSLLYL